MTSTSAPTTPAPAPALAARRPTATTNAAEKPKPSRTPYRPAADTTFGQALRAAATEAAISQSMATPSAARIGAPPDAGQPGESEPLNVLPYGSVPSDGLPGMPGPGVVLPYGSAPILATPGAVDARLWEGLMRGAPLPLVPARAATTAAPAEAETVTAMAARSGPVAPTATQAVTPAVIREQGQAFLRSIKGFDQTSVGEYESVAQARAWGYSTCSAASLTAVLRAAGQDVRIADVMKAMPGGMTIQLGLISRPSLVNAATQFGAKAADDVAGYEALKEATENGQPVLVDIRNGRFPEGHWIVVTGVDEKGIRCADSSRYDLTSIPRDEFLRSWKSGKGIRIEGLTPTAAPGRANIQSA